MRTNDATHSAGVKPTPQADTDGRVLTTEQDLKNIIAALGGSTTVDTLRSEMAISEARLKRMLRTLEKRNEVIVTTGYTAVRVSIADAGGQQGV